MLDGIHPILTGELLLHLDAMGHSDAVVVADAHFPAHRLGTRVVDLPMLSTPDVLAAIRTVHSGDAVIAPSTTRRLLDRLVTTLPEEQLVDSGKASAVDSLTDREREVPVLMARGRANQEIASDLFVAEATVKTHVGRILAKLGARDRVQAVVTAYETGLVRPGE